MQKKRRGKAPSFYVPSQRCHKKYIYPYSFVYDFLSGFY